MLKEDLAIGGSELSPSSVILSTLQKNFKIYKLFVKFISSVFQSTKLLQYCIGRAIKNSLQMLTLIEIKLDWGFFSEEAYFWWH